MSGAINDGGAAFPRTQWTGHTGDMANRDVQGMTLRQWYAGQALAGLLGNSKFLSEIASQVGSENNAFEETMAVGAFSMADAMIDYEEKERGQ